MSNRQNKFRDPAKRAAKRARQRETAARSTAATLPQPKPAQSQMTHASNPKARKKAREGERIIEAGHDEQQQKAA